MQVGQEASWKKMSEERLKAENRSLREKLAALRQEKNDLQRSLRDNKKLFHSVPVGIILIQRGRIIDINETALDLLGYTATEVIDRDFLDFVSPDFNASVRNSHNKLVSGKGASAQYETDLVTKNGRIICCDVKVKGIRLKGRKAILINLARNEKRKERERELIRSCKREALITMASGLNRELNYNLKTITENIKGVWDSENRGLIERVRNIESAAGEILNTARRLESISKRENDPSDVILFDLKNVVQIAISSVNPKLQDLAERGNPKINLKTYLRSVSSIEGNPDEIRDVIINLLLNAVEAMPQGGDLYLTSEENAGYANIYIQESGVGIPDHIRERILDPYYTTKGDDGIGLGLSLSYAIIRRHGGDIEVTSQKDQGTIFTVRLPLATQRQKTKHRPGKGKIKNAIILIIEGEDIIRELLSQLFVSKGHRVVKATSGLEGLHELKKKKFDLVMADSKTLDLDGAGLVRKIKKVNRELPVVLMAENEANDSLNNKESGADLVICKPLDMNKVVKQVVDLLVFRD